MYSSQVSSPYRRIAVIAVIAGVLAFGCSYLISPTYQASTRLIIHGHNAAFLSGSGQAQDKQPTLTDPAQAQSLADTYGSIATSRATAEAVVDRLHLDRASSGGGVLHALSAAAAWAYRCGRAFVTSGFCASVDRHEKAIADVQTGTTAEQLGSTAGTTAGQPGSYVLEITASGESGAQAQRVTDAVADELVTASQTQVKKSADAYIQRLQGQLSAARKDVTAKSDAVTAYETDHAISPADQEVVASAASYDSLRADLNTARADLSDAQAQLDSINSSISGTASTVSSDQQISTGRSDTSVTTSQANPVYDDLLTQRSQTEAQITGLKARITTLEGQVAAGSPTELSGPLADLVNLQDDLHAAQTTRDDITASLAQARTDAATAAPDLTRLDTAGRPDYPTSPHRYLYLLIGLVLGALAGGSLTWFARRRGVQTGDGGPGRPVQDGSPEFEDELLGEPVVIGGPAGRGRSIGVVPRPAANEVHGGTAAVASAPAPLPGDE